MVSSVETRRSTMLPPIFVTPARIFTAVHAACCSFSKAPMRDASVDRTAVHSMIKPKNLVVDVGEITRSHSPYSHHGQHHYCGCREAR